MQSNRDLFIVGCIAVGLAAISQVPYLLAGALTPEPLQFAGFLLNPWDGFSYLAKMNQGAQGSLLFMLPYAAEPGPGALVFSFYLVLGWLAGSLRLELINGLHAARLLSIGAMAAAGAFFLWRVVPAGRNRIWALALLLFGAGLGWVAGPMGIDSSDLFIPESVPFQSAIINPHFPLATALVAAAAGLILGAGGRKAVAAAALVGFGLGGVLPFAALPVVVAAGIWSVWEWWGEGHRRGRSPVKVTHPLLGLLIGLAPWFVYDMWLLASHPVLQVWNAQNLTASPPLAGYLAGMAPSLLVAAVGILGGKIQRDRTGRFLLIWLAVHFALAYAPINVQRRTMLGVALPLAGLVGLTLSRMSPASRPTRLLWPALIIVGMPTNMLVAAAGVARAAAADPLLTFTPDELASYAWVSQHVPDDSLVLAAPISGNRLPAFSHARVLYGHPFETPNAAAAEAAVLGYFQMDGDPALRAAADLGADYVLVGRHERDLGADPAAWATSPLKRFGDGRIFEVDKPQ